MARRRKSGERGGDEGPEGDRGDRGNKGEKGEQGAGGDGGDDGDGKDGKDGDGKSGDKPGSKGDKWVIGPGGKKILIPGGGPGDSTQVLSIYLYQMAFRDFNTGKGSALGYIMLVVIIALATLLIRTLNAPKAETA